MTKVRNAENFFLHGIKTYFEVGITVQVGHYNNEPVATGVKDAIDKKARKLLRNYAGGIRMVVALKDSTSQCLATASTPQLPPVTRGR